MTYPHPTANSHPPRASHRVRVEPRWRSVEHLTNGELPPSTRNWLLDDGSLTEIRPDPVPGGAPRGIFEQIGVEQPPL